MLKRILDTSRLIAYWNRVSRTRPLNQWTAVDAVRWANRLQELHQTNAIVTPVRIEFLAGAMGTHELQLARAFLKQFECVDNGRILAEDWIDAERIASRVRRDQRPRQLGDCLIRAISRRLGYDVDTADSRFP